MELVKVQVEVPKATYELEEAARKCLVTIFKALADGWQPMQDIPVLVRAVLSDLVPVVGNVKAVEAELKAHPAAMARLAGLSVGDLVGGLLEKAGTP